MLDGLFFSLFGGGGAMISKNFFSLFPKNVPKVKKSSKNVFLKGGQKCKNCSEWIHRDLFVTHLFCCPFCNFHYFMPLQERLSSLLEKGSSQELFCHLYTRDPLQFYDTSSYVTRLRLAREKSGRDEAIWVGIGKIARHLVAIGVFDFSFMGGSLGSVVGEKIVRLIEFALFHKVSLIFISSSGGARMQESIFSLMQMAKICGALSRFFSYRLPMLSILTHPTLGGATASFASLGDIILAEPGALIGFAGPKVIQQVCQKSFPKEMQRAEFLQERGMIDSVVPRIKLKEKMQFFLDFFLNKCGDQENG